jgi:aminoglycoside phosphotransferase (APT) family kinase protein
MLNTRVPEPELLTSALNSIFVRKAGSQVKVISREAHVYASTYPLEIVTCQLDDATQLRLVCKYSPGKISNSYGHRGGMPYEAEVYRSVLEPLAASTPAFHGTYTEQNTGVTWLCIEYLDSSWRLSKAPVPDVLIGAARWLAEFHTALEHRLARAPLAFLNRYTEEYYVGWARRACEFAGPSHTRFPWFKDFCERFEQFAALLLDARETVNHGEFYPKNVLIRNGTISPIDWESAAVALGEIDLASLTEDWPAEIVREWEREYQASRWPEGSPDDFERRLEAARLYLHFRWLGGPNTHQSSLWRFEQLRSVGERLGVI